MSEFFFPTSPIPSTDARVDQGVDFGAGDVRAVGAGTVDLATTQSGWPGGGFVSVDLNPVAPSGVAGGGVTQYAAEYLTPTVKPGQHVQAGQIIAHAYSGIEEGWGAPGYRDTLSAKVGDNAEELGYSKTDPGAYSTPEGRDFANWIQGLSGGRYQHSRFIDPPAGSSPPPGNGGSTGTPPPPSTGGAAPASNVICDSVCCKLPSAVPLLGGSELCPFNPACITCKAASGQNPLGSALDLGGLLKEVIWRVVIFLAGAALVYMGGRALPSAIGRFRYA